MPSFAATAATMRVWLDCTPPIETSVSALRRDRVGHDVFQLAQLVAAEGQAGIAVLTLGIDFHVAAEVFGEARQKLDRRGTEGQRIARELGKHAGDRLPSLAAARRSRQPTGHGRRHPCLPGSARANHGHGARRFRLAVSRTDAVRRDQPACPATNAAPTAASSTPIATSSATSPAAATTPIPSVSRKTNHSSHSAHPSPTSCATSSSGAGAPSSPGMLNTTSSTYCTTLHQFHSAMQRGQRAPAPSRRPAGTTARRSRTSRRRTTAGPARTHAPPAVACRRSSRPAVAGRRTPAGRSPPPRSCAPHPPCRPRHSAAPPPVRAPAAGRMQTGGHRRSDAH